MKTKALISFAVTAKLICVFFFRICRLLVFLMMRLKIIKNKGHKYSQVGRLPFYYRKYKTTNWLNEYKYISAFFFTSRTGTFFRTKKHIAE